MRTKPLIAIGAPAVFIGLAPPASSAGTYTTLSGPLGAADVGGAGINNLGQIVAWYETDATFPFSAGGFLYSGGGYTTFNDPSGFTYAFGINDSRQIVGMSDGVGFLYSGSDGYMPVTGPSGAVDSAAVGINNLGQIVGTYFNGKENSFLYINGSYTTLSVPGGIETDAYGVNDLGEIVGDYSNGVNGVVHGFLYNNGNYTPLNFPGSTATWATGINDLGQIVGYYEGYYQNTFATSGFLYANGRFTTLSVPGSIETDAYGINSLGQIVGVYAVGPNNSPCRTTSSTILPPQPPQPPQSPSRRPGR